MMMHAYPSALHDVSNFSGKNLSDSWKKKKSLKKGHHQQKNRDLFTKI
jgi:hypothetical protein